MRCTGPTIVLLVAIQAIATAQAAPPGPQFRPWINGTAEELKMQVQRIDADTFVIRQSVRTNAEAPFLYLLFGRDRALLIDTGAGGLAVRPTIDALIAGWLASNRRSSIPLLVTHSHSHGDHRQGDKEFASRTDTRVIGLKPEDVACAFGVANWPREIATHDLGGRVLSIIPTPGHEPSHIMVYDPRTRLLFSGDMLYPGRIYVPVNRWAVFQASADRVAAFVREHQPVALLGAHIEMTNTPGKDYRPNAPTHPDEHPLALPPAAAARLAAATRRVAAQPVNSNDGDFILYPRPPVR